MKGLPSLIKLKKREIDTQHREIAQLEAEHRKLAKEEKRLADELHRERSLAAEQPEMSPFYGDYSHANEQKQERLRELQQTILQEIDIRKEKMAELFGELKKFEITQSNILAEQRKQQEKHEQERLDEIAIDQHRRKKTQA